MAITWNLKLVPLGAQLIYSWGLTINVVYISYFPTYQTYSWMELKFGINIWNQTIKKLNSDI